MFYQEWSGSYFFSCLHLLENTPTVKIQVHLLRPALQTSYKGIYDMRACRCVKCLQGSD